MDQQVVRWRKKHPKGGGQEAWSQGQGRHTQEWLSGSSGWWVGNKCPGDLLAQPATSGPCPVSGMGTGTRDGGKEGLATWTHGKPGKGDGQDRTLTPLGGGESVEQGGGKDKRGLKAEAREENTARVSTRKRNSSDGTEVVNGEATFTLPILRPLAFPFPPSSQLRVGFHQACQGSVTHANSCTKQPPKKQNYTSFPFPALLLSEILAYYILLLITCITSQCIFP